jgi:gamma-tubulin complex component 3
VNRRTAAAEVARVEEVDAERKRAAKADQRKEEKAAATKVGASNVSGPTIDASELGIGKVPKSVVLQRWRAACETTVVPEHELLRDVIFILQGINGRFVRFEEVKPTVVHDPGVIQSNPGPAGDPLVKVKIVEGESTVSKTPRCACS